MKALIALLRAFAYVYFLLLSIFLMGLAIVAYSSGLHNINTGGMTSLAGESLTRVLLITGLFGIVAVVLSVIGRFRWLLQIFAVVAVIALFRGLFISSYRFDSEAGFRNGILLFLAAILATLGTFLKKPVRHGIHHSARK